MILGLFFLQDLAGLPAVGQIISDADHARDDSGQSHTQPETLIAHVHDTHEQVA